MGEFTKSEKEATEELRQFERRYDLLQYQIGGLAYWMPLRFPLHRRLMQISRPKRQEKQKELLGVALSDAFKYWFPKRAALLVRSSSSFFEFDGKQYTDRFFDELIPYGLDIYKIEVINSISHFFSHNGNTLIPSDLTTEYIKLQAYFLARFFFPRPIRDIAKHIEKNISDGLPGVSLPKGWIEKQLIRFHWRRKLFGLLIKRIGARLVLTSSTDDYALFAASQDNKIPCYEFQHGLFFPDHPDALWEYMSAYRGHLIAPTKLFLFGEFWKRPLLKTGFYREDELVVVGNARIDHYRRLKNDLYLNRKPDAPKRLLLTTQGIAQKELLEFIGKFLSFSEQDGLEIELIVKLHPRESDQTIYSSFFEKWKRVKIIASGESPPMYELLIRVDYHLSVYSASHFDALGLGIPTIVLGLPGYTSVSPLYESGDAMLAHTPKELYELVCGQVPNNNRQVSDKYYKPNVIHNVSSYLAV